MILTVGSKTLRTGTVKSTNFVMVAAISRNSGCFPMDYTKSTSTTIHFISSGSKSQRLDSFGGKTMRGTPQTGSLVGWTRKTAQHGSSTMWKGGCEVPSTQKVLPKHLNTIPTAI